MLIACIGNIFLGDDAFGVEMAMTLTRRRYPPEVQVIDFGIRGVELAYTLLDSYSLLVLIDAYPTGKTPGTVSLLEPVIPAGTGSVAPDGHSMDPVKVLSFAQSLGATLPRVLLVGCEPQFPVNAAEADEMHMGLSEAVQGAIPAAVDMVDELVEQFMLDTERSVQL